MLVRIARVGVVSLLFALAGCAGGGLTPAMFSSPSPGAIVPRPRSADCPCLEATAPVSPERTPPDEPAARPAGDEQADNGAAIRPGTSPDLETASPALANPDASASSGETSLALSGEAAAPAAAVSRIPVGARGLFLEAEGEVVQFPLAFDLVDRLMPGACPDQVRIVRIPLSEMRIEGSSWASATDRSIYFMSDDADFYKAPGIDATLFSLLFKVCLGQTTRQGDTVLSRDEKGLRFLEEGFAWYLQTRPEAAALGGRPEATRNFLEFTTRLELMHRFELADFWKRLPDAREIRDPAYSFHAKRIEAQIVAGPFIHDLVVEQGLGVEGYLKLWQLIAGNKFNFDANGRAIPENVLLPVLNGFLNIASAGRLTDLQACWSAFTSRMVGRVFDRPTVQIRVIGEQILISFSRDMLADRIDITLDRIQLAPERLEPGVGGWLDARTFALSLPGVRFSLGLDQVTAVQVNQGRIWQWFRSADGIPAEGGLLELGAR